jgi:hypothetical protein
MIVFGFEALAADVAAESVDHHDRGLNPFASLWPFYMLPYVMYADS